MLGRRSLVIAGALLVPGIVGCETEPPEEVDYITPTPAVTPTATNEPTPTASLTPTSDPNAGYRMASLVLEKSDGVDLDGDGRADNDYSDTLSSIADSVTDTFEDTCITALEQIELPEGLPTDNPTILCKSASAGIQAALSSLANIDEFNVNVSEAMAQVEYLAKISSPAADGLVLDYYWGRDDGGTYYLGDLISSHVGSIESNGDAELGPGEFTVATELGGGLVYMELTKSRTELNYEDGSVTDSLVGGVLTEEALVTFLLDSVSQTVPLPEQVLEPISSVLAQVIPDCGTEDTVMEDCAELGGISMGFSFVLEEALVY